MYKLALLIGICFLACRPALPVSPANAVRYDYSLEITFVEGAVSYQELMHILAATPGHIAVNNNYSPNLFHAEKHSIRVNYMQADADQMQQLKIKLARLGTLEIVEIRN